MPAIETTGLTKCHGDVVIPQNLDLYIRESVTTQQRTGVLLEGFDIYNRLTARQHLEFVINSEPITTDAEQTVDQVGSIEAINRAVGGYSKGGKTVAGSGYGSHRRGKSVDPQ